MSKSKWTGSYVNCESCGHEFAEVFIVNGWKQIAVCNNCGAEFVAL